MSDIDSLSKIHFIGIGGVSMSALARFFKKFGHIVTGSDRAHGIYIDSLAGDGYDVYVGQSEEYIKRCDAVIINSAIHEDNPELIYARKYHKPVFTRSEALAYISTLYPHTVSVAGTHGKTTTTAFIHHLLGSLNPSLHLGGRLKDNGCNAIASDGEFFITEACEYMRNFTTLTSECVIITSIEAEHMDCYQDMEDILDAYTTFARGAKYAIVYQDCPINFDKSTRVIRFGLDPECDIYAFNITQVRGVYSFDIKYFGNYLGHIRLSIPGSYSVQNCLCAIAVALVYGIDLSTIIDRCRSFHGTMRRDDMIGHINNIPIICDYAHHPHSIDLCISSMLERYTHPLFVFEPHTYSRTRTLFGDFVTTLSRARDLVLLPTYPAREVYDKLGDCIRLYDVLHRSNRRVMYLSSYDQLYEYIRGISGYDAIIILGAGGAYNYFLDRVDK